MDEYNGSSFVDDVFTIGTGGVRLRETGEQVQVTDTIARDAKGLGGKKTTPLASMPEAQTMALGQTKGFTAAVSNAFRSLAKEIPFQESNLVPVYPSGTTLQEIADELGIPALELYALNMDNPDVENGKILIDTEDKARLDEAGVTFAPAPEAVMQGSIGLDFPERD
tara:strand:- start:6928 stop:7428 length:501 start_codon:yes stop_codon:yes gene_type:complete